MAAAEGQPPMVSSPTTTNADQLKRETKRTDLTAHSGVIYQALPYPDHPEDNTKTGHYPGRFASPERRKQQTITRLTLTAARQSV
jgi:hypothetical protein